MKMHRRPEQGFTLLELLVVLVVLGLLAGIVAPKYFNQLGRSETKVARAQIEGLVKALDIYRLEVGRYPSTEQGLTVQLTAIESIVEHTRRGLRPTEWRLSGSRASEGFGLSRFRTTFETVCVESNHR